MTIETVSWDGHECVRLADEQTVMMVSASVGPRILGLFGGQGNLFAVLPEAWIPLPRGGRFRFWGGHRLWAAPEIPEITYQPDDRPCRITEIESGVRVEAPMDGAGLTKAMEVRRIPAGWAVDHFLRNDSGTRLRIAPWAVTQLRPGGKAVLPIGGTDDGLQASRCLVLWPYTDPGDFRLRFDRDKVTIDAAHRGPRLKVGVAPSAGRVVYKLGSDIFEKSVAVDTGGTYADRGAVVQVYLCDEFCELETLGPLNRVEPGGSEVHREVWTLKSDLTDPSSSRVEK